MLDLYWRICFFSCFCLFFAVFGCFFGCVFFWITFQLREWHHWIRHKILHQEHSRYWSIRLNVFLFFLVLAHFWLNFAVFLGAFFCTHFYSSGSSTIEFLMKFYTRNMYNIIGGNFFFITLNLCPISCCLPDGTTKMTWSTHAQNTALHFWRQARGQWPSSGF